MSNTIDDRIVSMKFDNSNFEKNAKESLETLEKLKTAVDSAESAKGLEHLGDAVNRIDFSGMSSAIEKISDRFSTFGIVGATIISNLTTSAMNALGNIASRINGIFSSIIGMISTGGLNRAMNIEKAKFQLEGLKIAYEDVYDAIDYAVTDTAYSLDAAAQAAAQLAASGLDYKTKVFTHELNGQNKELDMMSVALKAISGVAAQSQTDYSMVARYFQDIGNAGKVTNATLTYMTQVLNTPVTNDLAEGLNAIVDGSYDASEAVIANAKKITKGAQVSTADIKDLCSKGLIDFDTFATIMFNKYADHATEANRTLNGVTDNIKAAFSRIGADFAQPLIANDGPLVNMLEALRKNIKNLKTVTAPLAEQFTKFASSVLNAATHLLSFNDNMWLVDALGSSLSKLANIFSNLNYVFSDVKIFEMVLMVFDNIKIVVDALKASFNEIFGPINITASSIRDFAMALKESIEAHRLTEKEAENLKKTFKGLFAVIDIVKQAFSALLMPVKAFFSAFTGNRSGFLEFTGSIGDWLVALNESIKTMGIFEAAGKKMANVVTIIVNSIRHLASDIVTVFSSFGELSIQSVINAIIASFRRLALTITEVFGSITGINVNGALGKIQQFFLKLTATVNSFINAIRSSSIGAFLKDFTDKIKTAFTSLFSIDSFDPGSVIRRLVDNFKDLSGVGEIVGNVFSKIVAAFSNVFNILKSMASTIGNIFKPIGESIKKAFEGFDMTAIQKIFSSFSAVMITKLISDIIPKIKSFMKTLNDLKSGGMLTNIKTTFDTLLGTLDGFFTKLTNSIDAGILMKQASAILILAAACVVMSGIDSGKLEEATIAVGALFAEMTYAMNQLKGFGQWASGISQAGNTMLKLSAAVLILASAIKKISELNYIDLITSFTAISGLLWELVGVCAVLSKNSIALQNGGKSLIALSIGVLILSNAVSKLADLDLWSIMKGVGAVGALIAMLGVYSLMTKEMPLMSMSEGIAIIGMATGILILSKACEKLAQIKFSSLAKSLGAVAGLIVMLAAFSMVEAVAGMGGMIAAAIGLIGFAAAINLICPALEKLAGIKWTSLGKAELALGGLLAIISLFSVVASITGLGLIAGAAGMLIMSAALLLFIPTIEYLASASDKFKTADGALGLLLVQMLAFGALATLAGPGMIIGAVGLAAIGGALLILTPSLIALGAVQWSSIGKLAVALTALVVIGALATVAIVGFAGLSTVLLAIGAASVMICGSMVLAAAAIAILVTSLETLILIAPMAGTAIKTVIDGVIKAMIAATPRFIAMVVGIIAEFLSAMAESIPTILESVVKIGKAIGNAILEYGPYLVDIVLQLFSMLIEKASTYIPQIVGFVMDLLTNLYNTITQKLPDFIKAGIDLIIAFTKGMSQAIPQLIAAGYEAMIDLIEGMGDVAVKYAPRLIDAFFNMLMKVIEAFEKSKAEFKKKGRELLDVVTNGVSERIFKMVDAGKDAIKGFISGLTDGTLIGKLVNSGKQLGEKVLQAIRDVTGWASPWRSTQLAGRDGIEGLKIGLDQNAPGLYDAAKAIATHLNNDIVDEKGLTKKAGFVGGIVDTMATYLSKGQSYLASAMRLNSNIKGQFTSYEDMIYSQKLAEEGTYDLGNALDEITDKFGDYSTSTKGAASSTKETKDAFEELTDKIKSQIDIFGEFSAKTDLTADKLLANMKSQIDGVSNWANMMSTLGERGINEGLLRYLGDLGPQGYEYVNAFVNMTGEQLEQASQYFEQSLALPGSASTKVLESYATAGLNYAQGAANGIQEGTAAVVEAAENMAQESLDQTQTTWDEHSPSRATEEMGKFYVLGAVRGMRSAYLLNMYPFITTMGKGSLDHLKDYFNQTKGEELGRNLIIGARNGMSSESGSLYSLAESIGKTVLEKLKASLKEASPSKATYEMGKFLDIGLANGMTAYTSVVTNAADDIGSDALDSINTVISAIMDTLNSDMDMNPTITPVLDLSNIQNGANTISDLFNKSVAVNANNASRANVRRSNVSGTSDNMDTNGQNAQNFVFTQNNYSPKALSRSEIYRQTKNQFSQMKGLVANV